MAAHNFFTCKYNKKSVLYPPLLLHLNYLFYVIADPCPTLSDPLNGAIACTGPQVTDQSCSYILVKMATILLGLSVGPANLTTLGVVTLPAAHHYSVLSCWERTMHL